MANATSISEKLESIVSENLPLKEKFNKIAEAVYMFSGAKIMVCELFGPRWSYVGGWQGAVVPEMRVKVTSKYGIIAENMDRNSDLFHILSRYIKLLVSSRSD